MVGPLRSPACSVDNDFGVLAQQDEYYVKYDFFLS